MLNYSGQQPDAMTTQNESSGPLHLATPDTQHYNHIPVYKTDPPGPQTPSSLNTPHVPDLIECPVSDNASTGQDVLLEALSTPMEMSQVNDALFGIDRIDDATQSSHNDITFISPELIQQKDDLLQTTLFKDRQGKLLPMQKVASLTKDYNTPLYVRSTHQLRDGEQDIRLVSETTLQGTPNMIQPSHMADELYIKTQGVRLKPLYYNNAYHKRLT